MSAQAELGEALAALNGSGAATPCQASGFDYWTAEEASTRRRGIAWCQQCPLIEVCGAAAAERREANHVWGGVDYTNVARARRRGNLRVAS